MFIILIVRKILILETVFWPVPPHLPVITRGQPLSSLQLFLLVFIFIYLNRKFILFLLNSIIFSLSIAFPLWQLRRYLYSTSSNLTFPISSKQLYRLGFFLVKVIVTVHIIKTPISLLVSPFLFSFLFLLQLFIFSLAQFSM